MTAKTRILKILSEKNAVMLGYHDLAVLVHTSADNAWRRLRDLHAEGRIRIAGYTERPTHGQRTPLYLADGLPDVPKPAALTGAQQSARKAAKLQLDPERSERRRQQRLASDRRRRGTKPTHKPVVLNWSKTV